MKRRNGVISFWHHRSEFIASITSAVLWFSFMVFGVIYAIISETYASALSYAIIILIFALLMIASLLAVIFLNYKIEIYDEKIIMRRVTGKIRAEVKISEIVEISYIHRGSALYDAVFLIIRDDRPVIKSIYSYRKNSYIRFKPNAKKLELIKQIWPYEITEYSKAKDDRLFEKDREAYYMMNIERNRRLKIKK